MSRQPLLQSRRASSAAVAAATSLLTVVYAQEPPAPAKPQGEAVEVSIQRFNDVTSEEAARALVMDTMQHGGTGGRAFFARKHLVELRYQDLPELTKTRNINIEVQRQNTQSAKSALIQTDAFFDPVLGVTLGYNRIETNHRAAQIFREREKQSDPDLFTKLQTDATLAQVGQPNAQSGFFCVVIEGKLANPQCQQLVEQTKQTEFASIDTRPSFSWLAVLNLSKSFRWGSNVSLNLQSKRRTKDFYSFVDQFDNALDVKNPIGLDSRFPWSSTLSAQFFTPLPYARNFGEFGSQQNIGVKLADIAANQQEWGTGAVSNQVQGQLSSRYWQLVGALKQIQTTVAQRTILEGIVQSTRRLYEQQLITAYDMSQAQAQLENVRNVEEIAWNNYIVASDAVAELLDYESDTVVLPVGYSESFPAEYPLDDQGARQRALENRYELKVSQADIDSSEVVLKFRENQMYPDLSFQASISLRQTDNAYGYRRWTDSLTKLFDPDSDTFFVGVTYRLPFGKEAEKSALAQARIRMTEAADSQAQTELAITEQVNTALSAFLSARSQRQLAQQNMSLAELAYEKSLRLKGLGLATQFELLQTLSGMLTARSTYIAANVGYHQAHVQLQASEGLYQ